MFEALKSYFDLQEHCPTIIRQCFENPTQELNLFRLRTAEVLERNNVEVGETKNECCVYGDYSCRIEVEPTRKKI